MASSKLKVVVFLGSVRPGRMAERVGIKLVEAIQAKGMTPILLDPVELKFDLLQVPIHFLPKYDEAPEWMKEVHKKIITADAFLIASAEYNCMLPPALTNIFDHFPPSSFANRPCGILTYSLGPCGGLRAGTLLRIFVAEFGMFPVPTSIIIPKVHECLSEDGTLTNERTANNISKQLDELSWLATAIKNHVAVTPLPCYDEIAQRNSH